MSRPEVLGAQRRGLSKVDRTSAGIKRRQTLIDEFGVTSVMQVPEYKERFMQSLSKIDRQALTLKIKQSNISKYGTPYPQCLPEAIQRRTNSRLLHCRDSSFESAARRLADLDLEFVDPLSYVSATRNNKVVLFDVRHKPCGTEYKSNVLIGQIGMCPKCKNLHSFRSKFEDALFNFISVDLGIECFANYRKFQSIGIKEIDIYIPSIRTGFEINGMATHNAGYTPFPSSVLKTSMHHFNIANIACSNNIRLFYIWDFMDLSLAKSIVADKLGMSNRKYARGFSVKRLSRLEADVFYSRYHARGKSSYSVSFGLMSDGECFMSLSALIKGRVAFISRNAIRSGYSIIGGFSRLMSRLIEHLRSIGVTRIITFCDRDLSPDPYNTVYFRHNFEFIKTCRPTLSYWSRNALFDDAGNKLASHNSIITRERLMKYKLKKLFPSVFDSSLTEQEILSCKHVYPLYNSGTYKYVLDL